MLVSNDVGDRIVRLDNATTGFANHTLKNAARVVMSLAHRVGAAHGIDLSSVLDALESRVVALGDLGEAPRSASADARTRPERDGDDAPGFERAV